MLLLAPAAIGAQANYSTDSVIELASQTAIAEGLNKRHFLATLNCESGFVYNAKGDDDESIGVAQIDLKYHPEITYSEAIDPNWALNWMANEWKNGRAREWSCWRDLYQK